jgi:hypothetical protein
MRNVVRYSEAFKLRLVEDMAGGKYKSLDEAGRRNGIFIRHWFLSKRRCPGT